MKKVKPEKVPGSGRLGSNDTSHAHDGEEGMSVPSNRRGGSNVGGANDKGSGDRRKGEQDRNQP